ncbi:MAG TPA: type I 3-dehydroquinate dehydratase [Candidatus Limnocylindria bacterium]|nr:type I 3-dehydroquinate dehydratase [Candidatus Limnocylindria bacterium]
MSEGLRIGSVPLGGRPRLVAAGGDAEVDALAAAEGADLLELRADLFDDPEPAAVTAALRCLQGSGRPVILTVRHASEGGRPLPEARRLELYESGLAHADAIDLEIAFAEALAPLVARARDAGRFVILSAHFTDGTPPLGSLLGLVAKAETLGAHLTKLVPTATSLLDVRRLLEATLAAQPRPVATFAMGPLGVGSRIATGLAGSLLTYGAVGRPTAPGQLTVAELRGWLDRFYPA